MCWLCYSIKHDWRDSTRRLPKSSVDAELYIVGQCICRGARIHHKNNMSSCSVSIHSCTWVPLSSTTPTLDVPSCYGHPSISFCLQHVLQDPIIPSVTEFYYTYQLPQLWTSTWVRSSTCQCTLFGQPLSQVLPLSQVRQSDPCLCWSSPQDNCTWLTLTRGLLWRHIPSTFCTYLGIPYFNN